ncbi:glycine betaine ABC transporter substrate-binding protein [Rhodococcus fascians]|jgi:osmoprotectant transport system substrate-binding protein|uniref:glycine betaine ABC transporter substrate-binding protein n=1 Tax=Nocardiaceae TaxID=85025 RepID=UPI00050CEB61|nr:MULTISPECIES: glycine betaine ABC transporter substrate-binding protein [Rhodococcus]MDP9639333.1 osmoprotectant transport system substrate-binding protein [Rhodococcus cercidiphylli]MBX5331418.1 glycine betaine ABC transporter substrate-binding protein [Rhodococcus fascians]MBY3793226.1 glycine betaine ABC transporter substrate-binding protein [Rhodococcus fascians]MBY3825983.1 glycine betaine ABC transporter substrate-binding protein [Rhodococcus fascians]MBY3836445.1 glycine betaine ABC 
MRRTTRRLAALCATTALALTGCGLQSGGAMPLSVEAGSITPLEGLEGAEFTVGSKDFTEQIILGYILEFALSAAGADVRDLTNIVGSQSVRLAMQNGQVDLAYEYTGTGWINYLGNEKPIPDATEQFEAVRDADKANGIDWVNPAPMDNTYALAMNQQVAQETGVRTLSDYAALVNRDPAAASLCVETEFNSRQDGLPGLAATYGFDANAISVQILQTGVIYQATADGSQCRFGEVFTTDGRIKGLNLTVVEDDKAFFPRYNATVVVRQEIADRYPEIAEVTAPISAALTNEAISELNKQVDIDGREPADVARDWMVEQGFVTAGSD